MNFGRNEHSDGSFKCYLLQIDIPDRTGPEADEFLAMYAWLATSCSGEHDVVISEIELFPMEVDAAGQFTRTAPGELKGLSAGVFLWEETDVAMLKLQHPQFF